MISPKPPTEFTFISKKVLTVDEGLRRSIYFDSKGVPTIGIGHNLKKPITLKAVDTIFYDDFDDAWIDALRIFGERFPKFSEPRRVAIINMLFQLGYHRFMTFEKMIAAIKAGKWAEAEREGLDSKWAKIDSPERAARVTRLLGREEYDKEYRI